MTVVKANLNPVVFGNANSLYRTSSESSYFLKVKVAITNAVFPQCASLSDMRSPKKGLLNSIVNLVESGVKWASRQFSRVSSSALSDKTIMNEECSRGSATPVNKSPEILVATFTCHDDSDSDSYCSDSDEPSVFELTDRASVGASVIHEPQKNKLCVAVPVNQAIDNFVAPLLDDYLLALEQELPCLLAQEQELPCLLVQEQELQACLALEFEALKAASIKILGSDLEQSLANLKEQLAKIDVEIQGCKDAIKTNLASLKEFEQILGSATDLSFCQTVVGHMEVLTQEIAKERAFMEVLYSEQVKLLA